MTVQRDIGSVFFVLAALLAAGCSSDSSGPSDAGVSTPADAEAGNSTPPDADLSDSEDPPDDPDAACVCRSPNGVRARLSLRCYCESRGCKTYEDALDDCPAFGDAVFNQVKEYAACNLIEVNYGGGFFSSAFVYDATTHELVGARDGMDTSTYDCGASKVFGFSAGTLPPSTCLESSSRPRCPVDLDASKPDADAESDVQRPPNVAPRAE